MEQHFQKTSSADYSLKDGETLVLQIKNVSSLKSPFHLCEGAFDWFTWIQVKEFLHMEIFSWKTKI